MAGSDEFKNELALRLGNEEYERIGAEGHDRPNDRGQYDAAEVKSEFRNSDKSVEEMTEYFQGLADGGTKFNKRATDFLTSRGVTLGSSGGDETTPDPGTEDPGGSNPTDPPGGTAPGNPGSGPGDINVTFPTIPGYGPGKPGTGPGGGFSVGGDLNQNIGKSGDQTTTIGDGNTFGSGAQIGNDSSVTIGMQNAGNSGGSFGDALDARRQGKARAGAFGRGLQFS